MKKSIIYLLLFTSVISYGQITNLAVTESPEYKDEVKSDDILAIHTAANQTTGIVRSSKKNILFDIFDKDLNKTFSKVVESSKKERYVGDLFFGNELKVFTVYSASKKERTVFCHVFNLDSKTHKKVQLFDADVQKKQPLFSGSNKRQTSFAISPSGNYFAIATDNVKKNLNSYTVRVYDANSLTEVFKKSYFEDSEKFYQPNDIAIDDNAIVYSLGKVFIDGKRQKKKGDANYNFLINSISQEETKSLKVFLDSDEHIRSLIIKNNEEHLQLLGFYSEKDASRIKGTCSFIVNKGFNAVTNKKLTALPTEVYEDLYGYRKAKKKKKKELSNFYVDYIIEDSNGNTFLLAEEFYITQVYVSMGAAGGYWQTVYHYDDILVLKFNSEGNLDWGRSVFKRSTTPSYNAFLKNDKLHVILNSGKRLSEKKDGRTKVSKGWFESSSLYDFEYAASGETVYSKIQDNKKQTYYYPYYGTYTNGKFIMMSAGRKKKRFMSLQ